jgi:hypothetical protein
MVLAPSVAGFFKWRQFEPEMILLAVGWYLRFSLSYRDVEELLTERGLHADHVTGLEVGPALCARNGTMFALETQTDQRQLAGRLGPTSGSSASGATSIVRWILPAQPSTFSSGARQDAAESKALPEPKPWVGRTIPCRASSTPMGMRLTRPRSCGSKLKALRTKTVGSGRCRT